MVTLAVITAALVGSRWAIRSEGLPAARVRLALALIAAVTLAGARLHFVLANWSQFQPEPWRALKLSSGALHAPGAIAAAALGSAFILPLLRLPIGRFVDAFAPAVGLGIAVARLGCFLHGCCFGGLCPYPWGVRLPLGSYVFDMQQQAGLLPPGAAASLPVHALPLYFAAAGLWMTAVLLWARRYKRYDGELGLLLLVLYSATSALLEPLRSDDPTRVYLGPLPQLLWISAGMTVLSLLLLAVAEYRHRGLPRAPAPGRRASSLSASRKQPG